MQLFRKGIKTKSKMLPVGENVLGITPPYQSKVTESDINIDLDTDL